MRFKLVVDTSVPKLQFTFLHIRHIHTQLEKSKIHENLLLDLKIHWVTMKTILAQETAFHSFTFKKKHSSDMFTSLICYIKESKHPAVDLSSDFMSK